MVSFVRGGIGRVVICALYSDTHTRNSDAGEHDCCCMHQNLVVPARFLPICNSGCVHERQRITSIGT